MLKSFFKIEKKIHVFILKNKSNDDIVCLSVCKKWNNLLKDGSLWTIIDLSQYKNEITLCKLKKLISMYGCASTKHLLLVGNNDDELEKAKKSHKPSDELLESIFYYLDDHFVNRILNVKCPCLTQIHLEYLDLSATRFEHFVQFASLDTLSIKWCKLGKDEHNERWFSQTDDDDHHHHTWLVPSNLKHLYIFRSGDNLTRPDVQYICKRAPNLKTLSINQAKSTLRDDSVELIVEHLKNLQHLELNNTLITDAAVYAICGSFSLSSRLTSLNLTRSSSLSNNCLEAIANSLTNLKSLHLTSCFGISNIKSLLNLKNLNYLNINNTSLDKQKIKELLLPALKKCEIEYGHEKMLNRKLMWTINGSRNCVCSF